MFNKFLGVCLIIIIGLAACRKDKDVFIPTELPSNIDSTIIVPSVGDISKLYDALAVKPVTLTATLGTTNCIYTPKGTQICFDENDFVLPDGTTATGDIEFHIIEILNRAEMIMSNKPTYSNGKLLGSGGEFHISVTQNGQELTLKQGAQLSLIYYSIESPFIPNYLLFYGTETPNGDVNWDSVSTNQVNIFEPFTTQNGTIIFGYELETDSIGWINCDYFYPLGLENLTDIKTYVPKEHNDQNTALFIAFKNLNAVAGMYNFVAESPADYNYFTAGVSYLAPIGEEVTLVGISEIGEDEWVSAFKDITIQNGQTDTLSFSPTTLEAFEQQLNDLFVP
ncbi:MAG: hypothetical protein R2798_08305 [Chitinophagales bacterium]|nr:hypothetical protein [Bacteroidota bacterium]MCB9042435.1 hypothetical protein [Chitinophagales bacterium]